MRNLTLNYEDSVRTAKIALDDFNAFLQWDDGTEETISRYSFDETSPNPTNPEIADLTAEYVAGTTDETPADIAVEIGDWGNVIIIVATETGSEITYVYKMNPLTGIGAGLIYASGAVRRKADKT